METIDINHSKSCITRITLCFTRRCFAVLITTFSVVFLPALLSALIPVSIPALMSLPPFIRAVVWAETAENPHWAKLTSEPCQISILRGNVDFALLKISNNTSQEINDNTTGDTIGDTANNTVDNISGKNEACRVTIASPQPNAVRQNPLGIKLYLLHNPSRAVLVIPGRGHAEHRKWNFSEAGVPFPEVSLVEDEPTAQSAGQLSAPSSAASATTPAVAPTSRLEIGFKQQIAVREKLLESQSLASSFLALAGTAAGIDAATAMIRSLEEAELARQEANKASLVAAQKTPHAESAGAVHGNPNSITENNDAPSVKTPVVDTLGDVSFSHRLDKSVAENCAEPFISAINFVMLPSEEKVSALKITGQGLNEYSMTKGNSSGYDLSIDNACLVDNSLLLAQFAPSNFIGFESVSVRKIRNKVVLSIATDEATKLTPFRSSDAIWVRVAKD